MSRAQLYATGLHLYAIAPDDQVACFPISDVADGKPAALGEAAAWLRSKVVGRNRVDLLLASSMVRFAAVPWVAGTFTGGAVRRQVERDLAQRYGPESGNWSLRIQWPTYGWPIFAIAYPTWLLSEVSAALRKVGLASNQAMAMAVAAAARHGGRMPGGAGWIGFLEDEGLTGVHVNDGTILEVECLQVRGQGLDAPEVWCRRKQFEFPEPGQLRWLQAGHGPLVFRESEAATGSGSRCAASDLLMAIR